MGVESDPGEFRAGSKGDPVPDQNGTEAALRVLEEGLRAAARAQAPGPPPPAWLTWPPESFPPSWLVSLPGSGLPLPLWGPPGFPLSGQLINTKDQSSLLGYSKVLFICILETECHYLAPAVLELCSPGWLRTQRDPPASASPGPGSVATPHPAEPCSNSVCKHALETGGVDALM